MTYVDSARISTNAHKLQGKDTIALSAKYVDEGQTNAITNPMIVDNAVTSAKIQDGTIQLIDLAFTPVTRPLTPPVATTEIADGANTLVKLADNSVNSAKIVDGSIRGADIAKPCTLIASVSLPGAVMHIRNTGTGHGLCVDRAGWNGVYVDRAGWEGVWVDSAGKGIWARGYNSCGGEFVAGTAAAEGVIAHSFNNVATDTAIMAYGKGVATGGWGASFADGEAPCIVSPEMTMICYGTAKLLNGSFEVEYPKLFKKNIRSDIPVTVNLTPIGNPNGILCVNELKSSGFNVNLKQIPGWSGDNNISFSWTAIGTLKEPETTPQAKAEWDRMMQEREEKRQKTEQR